MKPFLREIGKLFNNGQQKTDKLFYGVVKEKITANDNVTGYKVSLGGDSGTIDARKFAGAEVGDTVMLCKLANGSMIVLGRKDGDADALEALDLSVEAMSEVEDLTMHFWYDSLGAHIKGDQTSYQTDITSNGLTIKKGGVAVSSFKDGEIKLGTNDSTNKSRVLLSDESFVLETGENSSYGYLLAFKPSALSPYLNRSVGFSTSSNFNAAPLYDNYARFIATEKDGRIVCGAEAWKNGDGAQMQLQNLNGEPRVILGTCYFNQSTGNIAFNSYIDLTNEHFIIRARYGNIQCDSSSIRMFYNSYTVGLPDSHGWLYSNTDIYTSGEFRWASSPATSGSSLGQLYCKISSVAGYYVALAASSKYLKHDIENVKDINYKGLYKLPVRQFRWNKDQDETDDLVIGFIADEVAEHFPEGAIFRDSYRDGKDAADWEPRTIIPAMLKLIQDQHNEIETLKQKIGD